MGGASIAAGLTTGRLWKESTLPGAARFTSTTTIDSHGGYVLASFKVRPWLQPAVKWEQLHDSHTTGGTTTTSRATWTTVGINVLSPGEHIRFLLDGIFKNEQPVSTGNELVAQLIAIF